MKRVAIAADPVRRCCSPPRFQRRPASCSAALYVHDVKTPTDKSGIESGADISLGYRGGRNRPPLERRSSPMSSVR